MSVDEGRVTLTLHRRIGSGAYSNVYTCSMESATDRDAKVYACKRIRLFHETDRCFLEAAIMASISHPCLATAHTIHLGGNDELFIVQERALGDLGHSGFPGSRGPQTESEFQRLVRWSHQILQGLACLHRERIVHGDVKADNVLLYEHDGVALTDFSLATPLFDEVDDGRTRMVITTVTHRAPEVHAVCHAEERARLEERRGGVGGGVQRPPPWGLPADVWSLGCTLYELAHGRRLFEYNGGDDAELWVEVCAWARSEDPRVNPWGVQDVPSWIAPRNVRDVAPRSRVCLLADRFPCSRFAKLFDDVVRACLVVDPRKRATLRDLLLHELFAGHDLMQYHFVSMNEVAMTEEREKMIDSLLLSMMPISGIDMTPGPGFESSESLSEVAQAELRRRHDGLALYRTVLQWARMLTRRAAPLVEQYGAVLVCQAAWRLASRMCVMSVAKYESRTDPVRRMEHAICSLLLFRFLEGEERRVARTRSGEKTRLGKKMGP